MIIFKDGESEDVEPTNQENIIKDKKHELKNSKPAARRGFASMDESKRREIASKGGRTAQERGTGHQFSSEDARVAGQKGGEVTSQNRRHMADIGRKGGKASRNTPKPTTTDRP